MTMGTSRCWTGAMKTSGGAAGGGAAFSLQPPTSRLAPNAANATRDARVDELMRRTASPLPRNKAAARDGGELHEGCQPCRTMDCRFRAFFGQFRGITRLGARV